jgi:glutaredoxin
MAAAAARPCPPVVRLEIVSKVGCVWCERLKARLRDMPDVEWFESAELDPACEERYAAQRATLLARSQNRHSTFPFVFDADSGELVGGHDAALEYIAMNRLCGLDIDAELDGDEFI